MLVFKFSGKSPETILSSTQLFSLTLSFSIAGANHFQAEKHLERFKFNYVKKSASGLQIFI